MISAAILFGLGLSAGPGLSEQQADVPESAAIYLEDKRKFERLLVQNDVDGAVSFFRAKAELCEETFADLTCPYYWGDLQTTLSDLGRSDELEYVRSRYVRSLRLAMADRAGAVVSDTSDVFDRLKREFDALAYSDPDTAEPKAREIIAGLPEYDPRWSVWLGDFARFYRTIERSDLALIIEQKRLSVLLAGGSNGGSLPYIALSIADLQLERREFSSAAEYARLALGALGARHASRIVAYLHLGEALSGLNESEGARRNFFAAGRLAESLGRAQDWQHVCRRLVRTQSDLSFARYASARAANAQEKRIETSGGFGPGSAALVEAGRDNQRCLVRANWLLYRGQPVPKAFSIIPDGA